MVWSWVTSRRANLHNEILGVMEAADTLQLPPEASLYAVAYRPVVREGVQQVAYGVEDSLNTSFGAASRRRGTES